jgi:hypothetical protein
MINSNKILLLIVIILFSILTIYSIADFGILGIFKEEFKSSATIQVFVDLCISLSLFAIWLKKDAKENNRNFVFWLVITLLTGSFGPLFYLLTAKKK